MVSPYRGAARRRGHHGSGALAAARALPVAVARGQGAHSTTSACPCRPAVEAMHHRRQVPSCGAGGRGRQHPAPCSGRDGDWCEGEHAARRMARREAHQDGGERGPRHDPSLR
jgi:hypothetical protein